jgi:hypothetical protein
MARNHAVTALGTGAIVAFALLVLQLYRTTQQLGEAFGRVSNEVGITRAMPSEPASLTHIPVENELRNDSPRALVLEATRYAAEPAAENFDDSSELRPSPGEEADVRTALQRALNDPDPEIRSEAAAVLGLTLSEETAPIPLRDQNDRAVGGR